MWQKTGFPHEDKKVDRLFVGESRFSPVEIFELCVKSLVEQSLWRQFFLLFLDPIYYFSSHFIYVNILVTCFLF